MATAKDNEQDQMIRDNSMRITRNEEAIKRQTEALEQIRDHYYPPPDRWWKKASSFFAKVVCVIVAYLGIAQTVDWLWNVRESDSLAERYAKVAERLYMVEGDVPGAILCLQKATEIDPKESEYVMMLAFLKGMALAADFMDNERLPTDAEQAMVDVALAEASVMKELRPKDPLPCVLVAQAYLLSGETAAAVAAVEQAVARAPKLAGVHVSACAIKYFAGRKAEARRHLAEAERLDSSLPLVLAWKGLFALWDDHDAARARTLFLEVTRRAPRYALAHLYLGRAELAEKNPDLKRARAAFSRALVLDAKLTGAMLSMAETYEREGKEVLSRLWLDRTLAVDGMFLPALVARARLNGKLAEWKLAVTDLTAAIALAPFRADLRLLRAEACEKAGDAVQAGLDRRAAEALKKE